MDCINDVQRQGQDIFYGLVRKLVTAPGTKKIVTNDATVKLVLAMYVLRKQAGSNQYEPPEWHYEHPRTSPLIKPIRSIMPIGLRLAISTMCAGEIAQIWIDPLAAYGNRGFVYGDDELSESIPPGAALLYEVSLEAWEESKLNIGLRYVTGRADIFRFDGMPYIDNYLDEAKKQLTNGKQVAGLRSLGRAIRMLERMRIDAEKEADQHQKRMEALFEALSLASECALEVGWYQMAAMYSRRMVDVIPFSARANFVLGRAYFALGYTNSAKRFVQTAWCNDPDNDQYKWKLQEICDHESFMGASLDSGDSDELTIEEELAEVIIRKSERRDVSHQIFKDVGSLIEKGLEEYPSIVSFDIKGGFSHELVDKLMHRFVSRNRGFRVKLTDRTSLEVEVLVQC